MMLPGALLADNYETCSCTEATTDINIPKYAEECALFNDVCVARSCKEGSCLVIYQANNEKWVFSCVPGEGTGEYNYCKDGQVCDCGSTNNVGATICEVEDNLCKPVECIKGLDKIIASRAHLDRIVDPSNEIVLIVNDTKNGIDNYIGPNSFAEIAFGFYYHKRVYLLNDIYEPYKDELIGWNIIPLKGDISKIK